MARLTPNVSQEYYIILQFLILILSLLFSCYFSQQETKSHERGRHVELVNEEKLSSENLNQELQQLITHFLNSHTHLSLNALAERSNTSHTTLRRIMHPATKTEPAPHTILNLVSYIKKESRIAVLLNEVGGAIGEHLKKHFSKFIFDQETKHEMDQDLNLVLQDPLYYFIYKLAANRRGTTQLEIYDLYGQLGIVKAQELVAKNILVDEKGALHAIKKNFSLDITLAKKHLGDLVNFYKPESLAEGKNLFYSLSESITQEAIEQIKQIEREAVKKIHQIMEAPASHGSIPYFAVVVSDTLAFAKPSKNSTGVFQ